MTQMRIIKVREIILAGAFCLSMWTSYPALAQPTAREWHRIEERVDRIDGVISDGAVNLERRLALIESQQRELNSQIGNLTKLGLGIMASVTGLIIQSLWGLIVTKKKAHGE